MISAPRVDSERPDPNVGQAHPGCMEFYGPFQHNLVLFFHRRQFSREPVLFQQVGCGTQPCLECFTLFIVFLVQRRAGMKQRIVLGSALKHVDHVLAAVGRIADEPLSDRVDDIVQEFQGDLADQDRTFFGKLRDVDPAITPLDDQLDGTEDVKLS